MQVLELLKSIDSPTLNYLYAGLLIALPLFKLIEQGWALASRGRALRRQRSNKHTLARLQELHSICQAGSLQQQYLNHAIENEVFRRASGLRTTDRNSAALMYLCVNRRISSTRFKQFDEYLECTEDGQVSISLGKLDVLQAWLNLVATIFALGSGLWMIGKLFYLFGANSQTLLLALAIEVISIVVGLWFFRDYAKYLHAKRLRKNLRDLPLPPCEAIRQLSELSPSKADLTANK